MATRADPLSPAALGIDPVGVLTRRVSPGQNLMREVSISLARVRFGAPGGRQRSTEATAQASSPEATLHHSRRYKSE